LRLLILIAGDWKNFSVVETTKIRKVITIIHYYFLSECVKYFEKSNGKKPNSATEILDFFEKLSAKLSFGNINNNKSTSTDQENESIKKEKSNIENFKKAVQKLNKNNVKKLKEKLKKLHMAFSGNKDVLMARLLSKEFTQKQFQQELWEKELFKVILFSRKDN